MMIKHVACFHSFIHQYSAIEAGLAGTRAQSCDRYGSGTLHPGQFVGGSLPLLSPAFRRSHFRRQMPVRPQRRERSWHRKVEFWARNCPVTLPKFQLPRKFRDLLHAANLRHETDGFTSPPKECVLRIFSPLKILTAQAEFEPVNLGTKASTLPLDHRSRVASISIVKGIVDVSLLVAGIVVVVCTVYNQRVSLFHGQRSVSQAECYRAT